MNAALSNGSCYSERIGLGALVGPILAAHAKIICNQIDKLASIECWKDRKGIKEELRNLLLD
jgi:hypothetical protein